MATVPVDLVDFLEGGVSILIGTRDPEARPDVARAVGARIARDRRSATIFLHDEWGSRALANLATHREIAVGFSRPVDSISIQLKGPVTDISPSSEADAEVVRRYLATYSEQLYMVGIPRSISKRFRVLPATAVTFEVRDIFAQTPGPDAGKPFGTR